MDGSTSLMPRHAPFLARHGVKSGSGPTSFAMVLEAADRFWPLVDVKGPDDCWEWQGFISQIAGHGKFQINRITYPASRIALKLHVGRMLSREELACHKCDNPPCCNPAHLFIGSTKDNALDAKAKGRLHQWSGARRGENNPCAKLQEHQVREIRKLRGTMTTKQIAQKFGVRPGAIMAIFTGQNWGHVK